MKLQCLVIIVFMCCTITGLTGCFDSEDDQAAIEKLLIGTWNDRDTWYRSYTFFENRTCIINGHIQGSYNITDNLLTIYYPPSRMDTFQFYLDQFRQRLQLTNVRDGYVRVYEKQ